MLLITKETVLVFVTSKSWILVLDPIVTGPQSKLAGMTVPITVLPVPLRGAVTVPFAPSVRAVSTVAKFPLALGENVT